MIVTWYVNKQWSNGIDSVLKQQQGILHENSDIE